MAEFKATVSQAAAINARGSAVLVSAGAGSGKTRVLTERLMGFITDPEQPVDIDSFLIITFTRAAAGELRGRIMDEIGAALAADPGNKRLRRQSALCQKAQIAIMKSPRSTPALRCWRRPSARGVTISGSRSLCSRCMIKCSAMRVPSSGRRSRWRF